LAISIGAECLQSILDSSKLLNSNIDRKKLLNLVLDRAIAVTNAEAGTLWLVSEEGYLMPVVVQGVKKEFIESLSLKPGEGLAGYVVSENKPKLARDVRDEPGWASRFDEYSGFETKSVLCIPLRADAIVIGCLELVNKANNKLFSEKDLEVAMIFAGHAAIALENNRLYGENKQLLESVIYVLSSALDAREPYARKHSERVTALSLKLAKAIGLSAKKIEELEWTALLHDVGKIGICDSVLHQQGPLDKKGWEIIKKHPEIGHKILIDLKPVKIGKAISSSVLSHHERYDGTGYPMGLKEDQIPLYARIIAIADSYDTITSDRPYRRKASKAEAMEEIRNNAGTQFDPLLVEKFLTAIAP